MEKKVKKVMLAVGVVLTPPNSCRLRRGDAGTQPVAYRCVVAPTYDVPGARSTFFLRSPCPDGTDKKQASCACKTYFWFTRAPALFPTASFFAKVEDDSVVHYDGLVRVLPDRDGLHWISLFQWATQEQTSYRGRFCGTGVMLRPERCHYPTRSVTTPFASGGFDLRSRRLVEMTTSCHPTEFTNFGSCDGGHGVHLVKCMHLLNSTVILHDFGWRNWRHSPGRNTLVVHNMKRQSLNLTWRVNLSVLPRIALMRVRVRPNRSLVARTVRVIDHVQKGL
jgi:hypothetical protein